MTKIANYCEKYNKNLIELEQNFQKIEQHLEKADLEYYNSVNFLKNVSIKKFVEHIVNVDENRPYDLSSRKKDKQMLSKEETDNLMLDRFRTSLTTSLEVISTRTNNNNPESRDHSDTMSIVDDDISVTSSRYFGNKNHKGVKIPFIIGTPEFSKNDFLGVVTEDKKVLTVDVIFL